MNSLKRPFLGLLLLALAWLPSACGGRQEPSVALAMEGPPLFIAGEYRGSRLEGSMDRTCMAGVGTVIMTIAEGEEVTLCKAVLDQPPTEKGRVAGLLRCEGGKDMAMMLRNLGPDQGVGLARADGASDLLVFFYHPGMDEAERRLPGVLEDIRQAREKGETR